MSIEFRIYCRFLVFFALFLLPYLFQVSCYATHACLTAVSLCKDGLRLRGNWGRDGCLVPFHFQRALPANCGCILR